MSEGHSTLSHSETGAPEERRKVKWARPFLGWTGWALALASLVLGGYLVGRLKAGLAERDEKIRQLEREVERLRDIPAAARAELESR